MKSWIEKQRYLIDFTLSSLLRRKGKSFGLLVVYTWIIFLLASVMFFSKALNSEAQEILQNSPEIIVQKLIAGRHELIPAHFQTEIAEIRGVQKTDARLWGYFYDPVTRSNYTLVADREGKTEPGEIRIGNGIARERQASVGDILSLRSTRGKLFSFRIKELFSTTSELVNADLIVVQEEELRNFFGLPPAVYTDLTVSVRNPHEIENIAQKIVTRIPNSRPILKSEILRTYDSVFSWREGLVFVILITAVLAFAILAWDKASGLSADEKREIGILKAIGWETSDVINMKLWEGAVVSFSAFLIGLIASYLHVFYAATALFEPVLKGWATVYPHFQLLPQIDAVQIITLFIFTVLPYIAATIVPIWRTAIVDPDTAMR